MTLNKNKSPYRKTEKKNHRNRPGVKLKPNSTNGAPGHHEKKRAIHHQKKCMTWVLVPEQYQDALFLFMTEFGYASATTKLLSPPGSNHMIGIKIENALLDLPLLKEEWYSFINKTKQSESISLETLPE